jgi:glycosyltransferase involved in cell wall biosynthesis
MSSSTATAAPRPAGISLFFPAYHDEDNIARVVHDALEVLQALEVPFDITLIEDGSPDRTGEVCDRLAAAHPELIAVVHHQRNLGYGCTLREGFQQARREWVFYSDGDYQYDLDELRKFWALASFTDAVVGFRIRKQYSFYRKCTSFCYNLLLRMLFDVPLRDVDCAFKLMKREIFDHLDIDSRDAFIDAEIMIKTRLLGYQITEVGVHHYRRDCGLSTGAKPSVILRTLREIYRYWRQLVRSRQEGIPAIALRSSRRPGEGVKP